MKEKQKSVFLSVVIPAYNEEINLKRGVLSSVYDYLKTKSFDWEVLIVDDGSVDNTVKMAKDFAQEHKGFKVIAEPHRGKGGTVIAGMKKAQGDYILFTDMDQSTPMDQFDKFIPKLKNGFNIVIGSRSGRPGQSILRKIMAYGFVVLRTLILRLPFKDTQCGFKVYDNKSAQKIFTKMDVFNERRVSNKRGSVTAGFDLETLYIARKLKLKIAEVPVEWWEYGERDEKNPIRDSWEAFVDLIKIRYNAVLGRYK